MRKPSLCVITDDFNTRSSSCWSFHQLLQMCFAQSIMEPKYNMQTSSSSYIDLTFTDKPNLSVNSGVVTSFHPNFHHQTVYSSFNLNISCPHHIKD